MCGATPCLAAGLAHAETLRVRSAPHFAQVHALSRSGGFELVGRLVDELGAPLVGHEVTAEAGATRLRGCAANAETTDKTGGFCFSLPEGSDAASSLTVAFAGDEFLEPAAGIASRPGAFTLELALDLPQATYVLGAAPGEATIILRGAAPHDAQDDADSVRVDLHLETSAGSRLGLPSLQLRAGETHTFSLDSLAACPPGEARLVARLDTAPGGDVTEASQALRIVSPVVLSWRALPTTVDHDEDVLLSVAVTAAGGPVETGWVELHAGARSIAISPVIGSSADLVLPVGSLAAPRVTVKARYLTANPDYLPAGDLEATLTIIPPPVWRHLPWILIACASVWWITRGWRRPLRRVTPGASASARVPDPVEVIRASASPSAGWAGFVRDAHTGASVGGATFEILVPSVSGKNVVSTTQSDGAGAFHLAAGPALPEGARLSVSAEGYSTQLSRVPGAGEILVRLTARRRKLLEELVLWTEARGRPWTKTPEATPRDVIRTADLHGEGDAKLWAAQVEDSAFGPIPPSPQDEAELLARRPR
jgi:hypothetical protein